MVELPNTDKLKQLPLRALVAYAVRCAMRVQLLYLKWQDNEKPLEGPPAGMAESVAEAIALASQFASGEGDYDLNRGQELEETVIEAVMRAKGGHRGAAFAANAAYAALNAANLASIAEEGKNRRADAEKVVLAVTTAADAAAAAHDPVVEAAVEDWHALQLMRIGQFPELGDPVDPRPEGKLGPLFNKKNKTPHSSWKEQSPTLRQLKRHENVLEQTREELVFQQEARKKDQAEHEAKCDEYEKTIRHLKAEVIPLKRERDDFRKQVEKLEAEVKSLKQELITKDRQHHNRLTEFANQLLQFAGVEPEEEKPLETKEQQSETPPPAEAQKEESPGDKEPQEQEVPSSEPTTEAVEV